MTAANIRSIIIPLIIGATACLMIASPARSYLTPEQSAQLLKKALAATALVIAEDENGGTRMVCTATAFERTGEITRFITAAHCVGDDDAAHERVELEKTNWYVSFDNSDRKVLLPAKVVAAGYQREGDDFAVLEVTLDHAVEPIPLAPRDPALGERVINIASPLGLGKQLFTGHVTMEHLRRPVVVRSINWKDAVLLQINVGGGSSGSSVISEDQGAIVAVLVGTISNGDTPNVVAIPIEKFKAFYAAVKAGTYKWFKRDGDKGAVSQPPR